VTDAHSPAVDSRPRAVSRRAHVQQQRHDHGRQSLAVLPILYPKELLTALDILAVELWGPPGPPRGEGAGRVQTYVCSVVRNALAFLQAGHADVVDGILFPHTCDSLQGLATLAVDFGGFGKPAFVFQHPRGVARESAGKFLLAEVQSLAHELEAFAGKQLTPERLSWALALHREIDACRAALLDGRARLRMSDLELYALLRRGEWLWPEEHLVELRTAMERLGAEPVQRGVPILVSGYVPEPAALLGVLANAGAFIVADDYAAIGRRLSRSGADVAGDPFAALVARYLAVAPCPTREVAWAERLAYLAALFERSGARGVLVHTQKFCEPELFDVPAIRRAFADRQVPVLALEGDLELTLAGQTETRVEAFVEMVLATRRAS
jgi:benzoyl-CoA reductase/2-hydroxyglutaryl-CoA dehydratase subunit BcrC/BadD/HgdB